MELRINYAQVIRQSNECRELANQLRKEITALDNFMGQIKLNWQGQAAEAYLKQCELLKEQLTASSKKVEHVSGTIRDVADRIKREDEAAAERAQRLSQGK
ncbi:WXG100 family type VII secretion target [Paenibacillus aurantiacus]|uniref:WXG100 family type VII secretion target n=1 Tax=Paenibacillus aurantiacus TaxID=1936118 RepID=A0ABV5KIE9_9BACL